MDNSIYYNMSDLLSHNSLFNFIVGSRGTGKTYSFKKWAIKDFLKNGNQFIYIRRYRTEFADLDKFFKDVESEFPNVKFSVLGHKFYINGMEAGYAIVLANAVTKKSVPYPKVNKIGFDEFLIDKGFLHYIPNEVVAFLELYETIARMRENVRVVFMANSISLINPYFLYFNIRIDRNKRFTKKGHLLVEYTDMKAFMQHKKNTKFGQLISDTDYGRYAIENQFVQDTDDYIERHSKKAKFQFSIFFQGNDIGFWYDYEDGKIYASDKIDAYSPIKLFLTTADAKPNKMYANSNNFYLKQIKKAFENDYLYYENPKIKGIMFEVIRFIGMK